MDKPRLFDSERAAWAWWRAEGHVLGYSYPVALGSGRYISYPRPGVVDEAAAREAAAVVGDDGGKLWVRAYAVGRRTKRRRISLTERG